ncbi:signaling peptide TAXIMIN 2-like [Neltuma alba]|uniref:signaling peptide TAXIMIN 2-like n=1 Tax=Neltuma alba TaxID=207710 RepID=UPI0010A4ADE5|nr:signaling peptide TAXIMIN 2-like [Prosopis alba]
MVDAVHTELNPHQSSHKDYNLSRRIDSESEFERQREAEKTRVRFWRERMAECRPLGFLIGLPFALIALVLAAVGAVIWVLGSILSCICPCCFCCSALANLAMKLIQLPVKIIRWFTDQIPC